jgi:glycine/D-amino acid oxidase-like deaminating enzyme
LSIDSPGPEQLAAEPCFWLADVYMVDDAVEPALHGHLRSDVCIVGGGYTGLWTAITLKDRDPSLDVVLVEAARCGSGSSGRNEGWVMTWWSKFPSIAEAVGVDAALTICQYSEHNVRAIGEFCERENIDAEFTMAGWLWGASSQAQLNCWRPLVENLARVGRQPFEELDGAEFSARVGSSRFLGGLFDPANGMVHPAKLARGLRTAALSRGVRIFENSPMTALRRTTPMVVKTGQGSVTAPTVVVAMNAWGAQFKEIRRIVTPVATDAIATEPMIDQLGPALATGTGVTDSHRLIVGVRATRDGRICASRGGGAMGFRGVVDESWVTGTTPRAGDVLRQVAWSFPESTFRPVTSWRGPIDYSINGLPFVGLLGSTPGLYTAVGFSGNGTGPSKIAAESLAAQILGGDDPLLGTALTRPPKSSFPLEPIRYIGARVVRRAMEAKERREDQGSTPSRVTAALAGLDPTSSVIERKSR